MKKIRIRHASGSCTMEVPTGSTVGDVAKLIENTIVPSILANQQLWKTGYPPRPVPPCDAQDKFMEDVDMIHVSSTASGTETPSSIVFSSSANSNDNSNDDDDDIVVPTMMEEPPMTDPDGIIIRRVMDADNSCLFNSIGYSLFNKSRKHAKQLRKAVGKVVHDDPTTFTEAFLGKPPTDYINFITDMKSWGGQIELLIFSQLFQCEIAALDIIRDRVDIYGTEKSYKHRIFVMYDGIHYDALAFAFDASLPEEMDITQFSPKDEVALQRALSLCHDQHRKKQFTDTSNFTLRCTICQQGLMGNKGAQQHAQETGHTNFAEFS